MEKLVDTGTYLDGVETLRRRELEYGIVREPPSPFYAHQAVVTNLVAALATWAREGGLGRFCVSPIDVVLDGPKALIVQPDAVFIATSRLGIIRNQIWGAPDLVVEVLSASTTRRDRTKKLSWYRAYGVREYWLIDPLSRSVEIVNLAIAGATRGGRRRFRGRRTIESAVLGKTPVSAATLFD